MLAPQSLTEDASHGSSPQEAVSHKPSRTVPNPVCYFGGRKIMSKDWSFPNYITTAEGGKFHSDAENYSFSGYRHGCRSVDILADSKQA